MQRVICVERKPIELMRNCNTGVSDCKCSYYDVVLFIFIHRKGSIYICLVKLVKLVVLLPLR